MIASHVVHAAICQLLPRECSAPVLLCLLCRIRFWRTHPFKSLQDRPHAPQRIWMRLTRSCKTVQFAWLASLGYFLMDTDQRMQDILSEVLPKGPVDVWRPQLIKCRHYTTQAWHIDIDIDNHMSFSCSVCLWSHLLVSILQPHGLLAWLLWTQSNLAQRPKPQKLQKDWCGAKAPKEAWGSQSPGRWRQRSWVQLRAEELGLLGMLVFLLNLLLKFSHKTKEALVILG